MFFFFFFNDTAPTEIYTLPLHDALPISALWQRTVRATVAARDHRQHPDHHCRGTGRGKPWRLLRPDRRAARHGAKPCRSEEHTSELQSPDHLVCRLLLEKKKKVHSKSV